MKMSKSKYGEHHIVDAFRELAQEILCEDAYKATMYFGDKLTVKATRKRYQGKICQSEKQVQIMFTIGPPNYEERAKIKQAKKAKLGSIEMTAKYSKEK
jgi:hypothetical protein